MAFPENRMRRLRRTETLRRMVRENRLTVDDVILPLFVRPGEGIRNEIPSMPGQCQLSVDELVREAVAAEADGIPAVILFGIPETKDAVGSSGYAQNGIVQQALRALRKETSDLVLVTDVCLCEYTDHGHCGVVSGDRVDNDATLGLLATMAASHADAGADMVAPSDMMDGRVGAIRSGLDEAGFPDAIIMAYAAKYASGFYGPFRDAAESPPTFGDRKSYQMDPANGDEALAEVALDIAEGADIVMTKPAMSYLDITRRVKERFSVPVATYNVSGEYSMVKAAAEKGWLDEKTVALEMLTSMKRAGADMILTYWARDVAEWTR